MFILLICGDISKIGSKSVRSRSVDNLGSAFGCANGILLLRHHNSYTQSSHVITTKFGVSAVIVPPVWHDIRLRSCFTSYTSRISIYSQPIPSEFTSQVGKVI